MKKNFLLFLAIAYALLASCTSTQIAPSESSLRPGASPKSGPHIEEIEDEKNVEQARRHRKRGEGYLMGRDFVNAKKEFLVATKLDPSNSNLWGFAGTAALSNSDYDEALQYFNKVIELNPESYKAYGYIGRTNIRLKKYDEAIAAFEKVLELNSNNLGAMAQLTDIHYELKEYERCEHYMNLFEATISSEKYKNQPGVSRRRVEITLRKFSEYRKVILK